MRGKNIALFTLDISDLRGGGGAERFFADFFEIYSNQEQQQYKLYFITDSIHNYKEIGKFLQPSANVILVPAIHRWFTKGREVKNPVVRKLYRAYLFMAAVLQLWYVLVKYRINLVHLTIFTKFHYPFFKAIDILPGAFRPKIVVNIVDHLVPYYYNSDDPVHINTSAHRFHYEKLFNNVHVDGVFSWYKKFKEFAESEKIIRSNPPIQAIKSRFVINHAPAVGVQKENVIVFASRLVPSKKPLFFLEAVLLLFKRNIPQMNDWSFEIYGKGSQEELIASIIKEAGLENKISLGYCRNMAEMFARTKCFVSTQDFENFPSLSMAEAMINRNAVIARNVGQTDYFVKDTINGYILKEDTIESLADAMEMYIRNPHLHQQFAEESYKLMTTVHTPGNFIIQIDEFWGRILKQ